MINTFFNRFSMNSTFVFQLDMYMEALRNMFTYKYRFKFKNLALAVMEFLKTPLKIIACQNHFSNPS